MSELDEIEKLSRAIGEFDAEAATEECRQQGDWPHCIACNGQYVVDIGDEATALCHACAHGTSTDLARFVLAVLPVVKHAEHWLDFGEGQSHCEEEDCNCSKQQFKNAISKMREELK